MNLKDPLCIEREGKGRNKKTTKQRRINITPLIPNNPLKIQLDNKKEKKGVFDCYEL